MIYLDYAAATPLDPDAKRAMDDASTCFANPTTNYQAGREAAKILESARKTVANAIGAKADEFVFTSGATEADNLAILGIARANKASGNHIVATHLEHSAVTSPIEALTHEGFAVSYCKVPASGVIDASKLATEITDTTVLVCVSLVASEIATIQPVADIARNIADIRARRKKAGNNTPLYLHCDASAALELINVQVARLGVDTLTLSAAKIYGPKGIGALYVRRGTSITPIQFGGGQEQGLRAGTPDVPAAAGFAEAVTKTIELRENAVAHMRALKHYAEQALASEHIEFEFNGDRTNRLASNLNIRFAHMSGEQIVAHLDAAGVAIATGAACTAGNDEPSEVLLALGLSREQANASIRVSFGRQTTQVEIDEFVLKLKSVLAKLATIYS